MAANPFDQFDAPSSGASAPKQANPFDQFDAKPNAPSGTGGLGTDLQGRAQRGLGQVVQGIAHLDTWLNDKLPFTQQIDRGSGLTAEGLQKLGAGIQESGQRNIEDTSPEYRAATAKGITDVGGFTPTNIAAKTLGPVADMAAPALASAIPGVGPALGPIAFGAQGEAQGREQGIAHINGMSDSDLAAVPRFQELVKAGATPQEARQQLGGEEADRQAITGGVFAGGLGVVGKIPGVKQLGGVIATALGDSGAARVAGNAAAEGVGFGAVNAAGQVASNVTSAVPTDPTQGVGEAFASGLLPGALLGGAHALGHAEPTATAKETPPPEETPPAGPVTAALDAGGIKPPEAAPAPTPAEPAAAAQPQPSAPSPLDAYKQRAADIDAMNAKRKSEGLTPEESDQLHDMRDEQDLANPVSGIPNRKALDQALATGEYSHAVALDIDGFKAINDQFGHKVGDLVLQELGQRLNNESNGNILFTHNSGDEYAAASKGDPTDQLKALQADAASKPFTVEYTGDDGKPVQHTFDGLGLTFGVGKDLNDADLKANASKEQRAQQGLRRRREDSRPNDDAQGLQTAEGSETPVGEDGRQGNLQEPGSREDNGGSEGETGSGASEATESPVEGLADTGVPKTPSLADSETQHQGVEPDPAHNLVKSDEPAQRSVKPDNEAGGIGKDAVSKTVGDVVSQWKGDAPKVEVHGSHDEAPPSLKNSQGFDRSVEGAYDPKTGTVHLFGDAIKSPRRALEVLTHEAIGHHGIDGVVGKDFPKLVADINAKRANPSPAMKKIFDEVERRYKGADPHTFASEAMAVMSEKGSRNAFMDRAIAAVRKFVRGLGVNLKFSDAELRQMLVAADRRVKGSGGQTVQRDGSVKFHKAYHGSPHDFDQFDSSKIGTGEGAQAYGHGLYFAGKKEVADHYRGKLANPVEDARAIGAKHGLDTSDAGIAQQDEYARASMRIAKDAALSRDQKIAALERQVPPARKLTSEQRGKIIDEVAANKGGRGYEVELAPKEHEYLDWDKKMSEQSPQVRAALESVDNPMFKAWQKNGAWDHISGQTVYKELANGMTRGAVEQGKSAAASKALHEAGIPGIKYLDGSSRSEGEGHHNYVIFNDKDVQVTAKYSKADTAAVKDDEKSPSFLDRVTGLLKPSGAERATRALDEVARKGRELARNVSRAAWAMRDRATGQADAAIDAFRTHFDKRPADVRSDPLKSYESVIAYQQKKPIADPVEKKFIDTVAGMLDKQANAIRAFGEDKLGLLDQYFPQLWKDPERAEKMYSDMQAKRPLAGPKGFTKERVFADMEQGIKAGMKPAFDNPADALMARYQSGERYLAALRIKDGIDKLGMLQDIGQGDRVPQGFARVNDNTFAGKVVPELVAKDLNNYLAPGLSQFKAWRGFRWMQNALLSARLGFSAFHAGFTTVDSAMTHLDLGMRKALSGDISAALKHLAQIPLTPIHAVQGLFGKGEGASLVRQFYGQEAIRDPQTAAVLDALTQGGARGRMDPTDYNNDFAQSLRTLRTDGIKGLAKTPLKSIGAVLEGVMRPIAHSLVPAQKMTARVELMKYELDRLATQLGAKKGDYAAITKAMNQDALRQVAHSVVQRVDDRLGQLSYDNLMWNRTVKDILQASIQSVGWNVGTKNVIFGGLADVQKIFKPESLLAPLDKAGKITDAQMSRITGRLSYLVALNLGIGALGATTQYLLTGQGPQELKDYFFPKTGNKNPDGTDARISFPSYVKDEFGFARHPIETVEHKLHPSFSMVTELLNNKDFYGNEVYDPDAPWSKVAAEVAGHVAKGFLPYAVQNQQNIAQAGGGLAARAAPFVGITPAPGDETHSDASNYISNAYYSAHPSESKTPEQADHSHAFTQAVNAIRQGQQADLSQFTPAERAKITKYAHEDPAKLVEKHFAALSLQQQVVAYQKASDAERKQYNMRGVLLKTAPKGLEKISDPETRQRTKARIDAIRSGQ